MNNFKEKDYELNYILAISLLELIKKIRDKKDCPIEYKQLIDIELKKIDKMMIEKLGIIKTPLKNGFVKWEYAKDETSEKHHAGNHSNGWRV